MEALAEVTDDVNPLLQSYVPLFDKYNIIKSKNTSKYKS